MVLAKERKGPYLLHRHIVLDTALVSNSAGNYIKRKICFASLMATRFIQLK